MSPFVTVNGRSYLRESFTYMRPNITGQFVAEFCRGLGDPNPSLAVIAPAHSEVGAVAPGVPEGPSKALHRACPSGTSIPIYPTY